MASNLQKLVGALVGPLVEAEAVAFDIWLQRTIDGAVGDQLDGVGSIIGEERNGRSDALYRDGIRARVQVNLSNGSTEDLISVVRLLGGDVQVEIKADYPNAPAAFRARVTESFDQDGVRAAQIVRESAVAGVYSYFQWFTGVPFKFDTAGQGFDTPGIGMAQALEG